jgi:competence protein ComFC
MWQEILSTLFPNRCIGCETIISSSQPYLCEMCKANLPFIHTPFNSTNAIHSQINKSVKIEFASSLLLFSKENITQQLIHHLKYKNKPEIGSWLAEIWFKQNENNPYLKEIKTIIPVPIHSKRYKKRSYNQITLCCKKLATLLHCNLDEHTLQRVSHMESQTQSNKEDRIKKMKNAFKRNSKNSSHYLLVDDVLTTGATLIACTQELLKIKNSQVSIFTLAATV